MQSIFTIRKSGNPGWPDVRYVKVRMRLQTGYDKYGHRHKYVIIPRISRVDDQYSYASLQSMQTGKEISFFTNKKFPGEIYSIIANRHFNVPLEYGNYQRYDDGTLMFHKYLEHRGPEPEKKWLGIEKVDYPEKFKELVYHERWRAEPDPIRYCPRCEWEGVPYQTFRCPDCESMF